MALLDRIKILSRNIRMRKVSGVAIFDILGVISRLKSSSSYMCFVTGYPKIKSQTVSRAFGVGFPEILGLAWLLMPMMV